MAHKTTPLLFLAGSFLWGQGGPQDAVLTPGWDIFNSPLASGRVSWQATEAGNGQYSFSATFQVQGALPNHRYTAGAHFFEPAGAQRANVTQFGGYSFGGGRGTLSREGVSATVIGGWDFGVLSTDGQGNGRATFSFMVPARPYELQFTVRIGTCTRADQSGCAAVFRSGRRMGQSFEVIRGPGTSRGTVGTTTQAGGACAIKMEANTDRYAGDYATPPVANAAACCAACERDPKCRSFAFVGSQGTCYLKDSAPAPRSAAGIISGAKGGTAVGAINGVRYRIENFVYNQPDVYQNPRNYHDFIVDFGSCRIRPLNPTFEAGQEEIKVLVCREGSRLTFTSRTPGSFVEYDWVFTNNGQTIHGAYRQGANFGPIAGGVYRGQ